MTCRIMSDYSKNICMLLVPKSDVHSCKEGRLILYTIPYYHLLLDSAPNLGPLISRWEINKFENG